MDIRLIGDRGGIDTAVELFHARGIRCIFATRHRAAAADPLGWLQKPYTMSSLVVMVHQAADSLQST